MSAKAPVHLRCESLVNPLGLGERAPRLSWRVNDARRGARQSAWQIVAAAAPDRLDPAQALWDSGKVSGDATRTAYAGPALKSAQRVWWAVRTWDAAGQPSPWSEPAWFEMGLLDRSEWKGEWIGSRLVGASQATVPAPFLRRTFALEKPVASARLHATALGLYEARINGQRVGEDLFAPGWTDYKKRVQYQVYDVTGLVKQGANAIGAILGDGWYCGCVEWRGRQRYGDRPKFLAQLVVVFADGSTQTICTDDQWRWNSGPIVANDMQNGETYDARLELGAWDSPAYDDTAWAPVERFADPGIQLSAMRGPTVRVTEELSVVKWNETQKGQWIADLGQNMVGVVRLKVQGPAGTTVRLRFGEVLNSNGTLYTENLRQAKQTDYFTLKGTGEEIFEPRFTFHGFRYVEVRGLPGQPGPQTLTGLVLHSVTPVSGTFECSDPLINQLQKNITWGQRGNFVDIPTDCPQRDERMGWTGDAQVFVRTAAFNMDVAGFFAKWLQDLFDSQYDNGAIPPTAPDTNCCMPPGQDSGPAWSDAAVICPWTIYLCYGDTRTIEEHFDGMCRFVAHLVEIAPDCIRSHPARAGWAGYGDWLSTNAETPKDLLGTAFLAYSARLVGKMARVIGRTAEAEKHEAIFERARKAFQHRFVTPAGLIAGQTQTAYVLALHFDLLPPELRPVAMEELVRDIERRGNHLSTGFVGTPYITRVLSDNGRLDVAYKLLHQKTFPSWLYPVTQGATTIWERWDGWTHDRGFQDVGMNSFNHYAYGAIGDWLYSVVAGLDLDANEPAYKRLVIRPRPGGGLTHARARLETIHGLAESGWKIVDGRLIMEVLIPANTRAVIHVPAATAEDVLEGGRPAAQSEGLKAIGLQNGAAVFEAGAGRYVFESPVVG